MARLSVPRSLWLELGTALVVVGIVESELHCTRNIFPHGAHVALLTGVSKGLATILLLIVRAVQFAACVGLVVPAVYEEVGALAQTAILAQTLWLERLLLREQLRREPSQCSRR